MKAANVLALSIAMIITGPFFRRTTPVDAQPLKVQKEGQDKTDKEPIVKISVTLVQLDAVVTNRKGNPVSNLRKEDFEIYQDGKRQQITNLSFVDSPPKNPTVSLPDAARDPAALKPPPISARINPGEIRRTIAIVVDDLSLSMSSAESVQYHLRKFVERQMEDGDLVAIIRASGGMGALQQFTNDRRQLYSAVDRIRWNPQGRIGLYQPISDEAKFKKPTMPADRKDPKLDEASDDFREQLFTIGMFGAMHYVIRGLQELPGRKSILLFSEGFNLPGVSTSRQLPLRGQPNRIEQSLNRLIEYANRSAVVIYAIDPRGVVVPMIDASDNTSGMSSERMNALILSRETKLGDTRDGLTYLASATGGFVVPISNDLGRGIRRVLNDQAGYYLIGYVPEESAFRRTVGPAAFHRVLVKVRIPGLQVRTRGGFLGVSDEDVRPARRSPMQQLTAAVTSPFTAGDIRLKLTSLFGNDSQTGYFVRSLLHINAKDLTFIDDENGLKRAEIELIAITFGDNGVVVDEKIQSAALKVRNENLERTLRTGITCTINLPLKKPGAYQFRTAVRDVTTELIGSANQYIEVPDLSKGRLALSTVTLGGNNSTGDLSLTSADSNDIDDRTRNEAGPAVRRLRAGDELNYFFVAYNAKVDKSGLPKLLMQVSLYRDKTLVHTGDALPVELKPQQQWKRINIGGSLKLTSNAAPGKYVIHIRLTDTLAKESRRTVDQWADFEVVK
jgi:VWFA-related protein